MSQEEKFEPKELAKLKRLLRMAVDQFVKAVNCRPPEKLPPMLSKILFPRCTLSFVPLQVKTRSSEKIIKFWQEEKKKGLTDFKLTIRDFAIGPLKKTVEQAGKRSKFDARGIVTGRYSYVKKEISAPPRDPDGFFSLEFCHREDCSWWLENQIYY